jgi:hypothetical protein
MPWNAKAELTGREFGDASLPASERVLLLAESSDSLDRLGVGLFLVPEVGPVVVLTVPSLPQLTSARLSK